MIKNVIFDFGQVIVSFEPSYMVSKYVTDSEDAALLEAVVFDRLYWDKLDEGTVSDSQVVEEIKTRIPERLYDVAEKIYYNWIYNIPLIDGIVDVISWIKNECGVKLYLLSNISKYFASHKDEFDVFHYFDGLVFSAPLGIVKPQREIFEYITDKYSLNPDESIFIDDNPKNIQAAQEYGIKGYLFDKDTVKLKKYLKEIFGK